MAYRPSHRGPVLVTGGTGTGKTVTALHRAALLAQRRPPGSGRDILLTTFTRNLVEALDEQPEYTASFLLGSSSSKPAVWALHFPQ